MAAAEYTLTVDDKIKDLVEVDAQGKTTKTTTVTIGGGDTLTSTNDDIAEQAGKAKDHMDDAEITIKYDDTTNIISGIGYELTK